eukprot:3786306-Alexandrium_andersonii.AAC.1
MEEAVAPNKTTGRNVLVPRSGSATLATSQLQLWVPGTSRGARRPRSAVPTPRGRRLPPIPS